MKMNVKSRKQIFNLKLFKMKKVLFYVVIAFAIFSSSSMMAQQGIGTNQPDKSAALDIVSTKRGLLIPRISIPDLNAASPVTAPATSLLVYNEPAVGVTTEPGFYYWDGGKWVRFMDTDSDHTTSVVAGQGIVVTPDTTDPNNTEYTVSLAKGASNQMVMVTKQVLDGNGDPVLDGNGDPILETGWVSYADFIDDLIGADNGLTYDPTTNKVKLGGSLSQNTTINTGANSMIFNIDAGGSIQIKNLSAMDPADYAAGKIIVQDADGELQTYDLTDLIDSVTYTASNGLTMTNDNDVQLGGNLSEPTTITTTAANTLAVAGLTDATAATGANSIVVADDTTGVLRTVARSISTATNATLTVASMDDYSPFVQEINIFATVGDAADLDITLPAASELNKGQVVNVKIANISEPDKYLNIKVEADILTYGAMPYQSWIIKSTGAATGWQIVGRN
jgi:hypothetical protein